jgi:hypothetical protein
MKARRKQRKSQTFSTQPVASLSLFVSEGGVSDQGIQSIVELSSDESKQSQLTNIPANLDTDQDCACE